MTGEDRPSQLFLKSHYWFQVVLMFVTDNNSRRFSCNLVLHLTQLCLQRGAFDVHVHRQYDGAPPRREETSADDMSDDSRTRMMSNGRAQGCGAARHLIRADRFRTETLLGITSATRDQTTTAGLGPEQSCLRLNLLYKLFLKHNLIAQNT